MQQRAMARDGAEPLGPTPWDIFRARAEVQPAAPLLLAPASAGLAYAPGGFRISYGEALARATDLRGGYAAAGIGAGSRVALLLENRPEFFLHWLALNALGASIVPLNPDLRPAELAHQLVTARPDLVVAVAGHEALLAAGNPGTVPVAAPDGPLPSLPGRAAGGGDPQAECALLFTSGSTGRPKACILSNAYFTDLAEWYVTQAPPAAMIEGDEVALTPLPLFHMNALGCTGLGMIATGGAIVPLDRFHAGRFWQVVADSGATLFHCLGVIPAILMKLPPGPYDRAHRARFTLSPGTDAATKAAFEARFGVPVVEGWAMTETGGGAVTSTAGVEVPPGRRGIGRMRDGTEWRLVGEDGRDVPAGQPGELLVRREGADLRRGFFSGYLGLPEETEAAWAGGWFRTGDLMTADPEGRLYFWDRRKAIVRRSGENISVLEVEAALVADPAVQAAAVCPVADEIRGEEVFALVVPAGDLDADALLRRLAGGLSYHKLPGWIAGVGSLPLGATQKLQRAEVKALATAAMEAGTATDLRALKTALRRAEVRA